MGGMRIDFSEVEDTFEVLPEGRYECVVEDCQVRESKSSDNNYLNWEFKIIDGEYEDRRIWIGTSFSPKALAGMKQVLVNIGAIEEDDEIEFEWDESVDITPKEGPQLTYPDVIGLPASIVTVNKVYEGRERQDAWASRVEPTGSDGEVTASKGKGKKGSGARKRKLR
jgi:hypothetical protein